MRSLSVEGIVTLETQKDTDICARVRNGQEGRSMLTGRDLLSHQRVMSSRKVSGRRHCGWRMRKRVKGSPVGFIYRGDGGKPG